MRFAAFILSTAAIPALLFGDTLTLRDGTVLEGTFLNGGQHQVVFRDYNGARYNIPTEQIQSLNLGPGPVSYSGEANRQVTASLLETLPAGTTIAVRTGSYINSSQPGQTYMAVIDQNVMDPEGRVVIPAGSTCNLIVRTITPVNGPGIPVLGLDLQSIWVGGLQYFVTPSDMARNPGETVLGNLVGVPPGQNVITQGTVVMAPPNRDLTFQLNAPLTLRASIP
jgi:hypothetical protein